MILLSSSRDLVGLSQWNEKGSYSEDDLSSVKTQGCGWFCALGDTRILKARNDLAKLFLTFFVNFKYSVVDEQTVNFYRKMMVT